MSGQVKTCKKCGIEVVEGINAVPQGDEYVCEECAVVRHGFAETLSSNDRMELYESLQEDLRLRDPNSFASLLMRKALEDIHQ